MRQNQYKSEIFKKDMMRLAVISIVIVMVVFISLIVVVNAETEQLLIEGQLKSSPLISNETISRLGDLYINLNREFEAQIKQMETGYANRLNKRGDKIFYGVNGKENPLEMINNDYVNGIENIEYIKNNADRKDGSSNFNDMITVLNATLQSDLDRYDDKIEQVFTELFWMSHTFTGESTELYPCEHGCSFCKYYCGDIRVKGSQGNNIVGFYNCDEYMGERGKYGLMYDPFLISKRSYYPELEQLADSYKTLYEYNVVEKVFEKGEDADADDEPLENHVIVSKMDIAYPDTIDIFNMFEPEGFCEVHTRNSQTFTSTTKTFGGCINNVVCHHGKPRHLYFGSDDEEGTWVDWYMGKANTDNCTNVNPVRKCNSDDENHVCENQIIGCKGYYECKEGHNHYACPGHIIVCCFGHTNIRLKIKIMYYEEMLEKMQEILENIN